MAYVEENSMGALPPTKAIFNRPIVGGFKSIGGFWTSHRALLTQTFKKYLTDIPTYSNSKLMRDWASRKNFFISISGKARFPQQSDSWKRNELNALENELKKRNISTAQINLKENPIIKRQKFMEVKKPIQPNASILIEEEDEERIEDTPDMTPQKAGMDSTTIKKALPLISALLLVGIIFSSMGGRPSLAPRQGE